MDPRTIRNTPTEELTEILASAELAYAKRSIRGATSPRLFVLMDNIRRELACR